MRVPTLAAVALAALLTACAASPRGDAPSDDLSASEIQVYSFQQTLPLPVSTSPGDVLLYNPMLAIEVLEVLADGRPVAAKPAIILVAGLDTRTVTVQSATYYYNIDLTRPLLSTLAESPDLKFVKYSIPEDTEVLVIRYRLVRHGSASGDRVYTVKATRSP